MIGYNNKKLREKNDKFHFLRDAKSKKNFERHSLSMKFKSENPNFTDYESICCILEDQHLGFINNSMNNIKQILREKISKLQLVFGQKSRRIVTPYIYYVLDFVEFLYKNTPYLRKRDVFVVVSCLSSYLSQRETIKFTTRHLEIYNNIHKLAVKAVLDKLINKYLLKSKEHSNNNSNAFVLVNNLAKELYHFLKSTDLNGDFFSETLQFFYEFISLQLPRVRSKHGFERIMDDFIKYINYGLSKDKYMNQDLLHILEPIFVDLFCNEKNDVLLLQEDIKNIIEITKYMPLLTKKILLLQIAEKGKEAKDLIKTFYLFEYIISLSLDESSNTALSKLYIQNIDNSYEHPFIDSKEIPKSSFIKDIFKQAMKCLGLEVTSDSKVLDLACKKYFSKRQIELQLSLEQNSIEEEDNTYTFTIFSSILDK